MKALLHAVAVARLALLNVVTDFEHGALPWARYTAMVTRLREQLAQRDEEIRVLRSRIEGLAASNRPHYPPPERLAILTLPAAAGWMRAETAQRFLVSAKTVSDWMRRLDEHGPNALVAPPTPVSRFPDYVALVAQKLKAAVPTMGTRRLADTLARAGLNLSRSTVGRLLSRSLSKPPPEATTSTTEEPARAADASDGATGDATTHKTKATTGRVVTARYAHHVWHIDISLLPTVGSFWVPWFPFSLPQCWPFAFHLALVLDHFSRSVVAWKLFCNQPSARAICSLLDDARDAVGRAPKYIVSDQGAQFQHDYRGWCDDNDVVPRFGAIGQSGSIAVLERFLRSFKDEMLRRLLVVPGSFAAMQAEVRAHAFWYNRHRPMPGARRADSSRGPKWRRPCIEKDAVGDSSSLHASARERLGSGAPSEGHVRARGRAGRWAGASADRFAPPGGLRRQTSVALFAVYQGERLFVSAVDATRRVPAAVGSTAM